MGEKLDEVNKWFDRTFFSTPGQKAAAARARHQAELKAQQEAEARERELNSLEYRPPRRQRDFPAITPRFTKLK